MNIKLINCFRISKFLVVLAIAFLLAGPALLVSPKAEAAGCTTSLTLNYFPNGSGPPTTYTASTTITYNTATDNITLSYSVKDCLSATSARQFGIKHTSKVGTVSDVTEVVARTNLTNDVTAEVDIPKPTAAGTGTIKVVVYDGNVVNSPEFKSSSIVATYKIAVTPTNTNTGNGNTGNGNGNSNTTVKSFDVKLPEIEDPFNGGSLSKVVLQVIRILFALIIMAAVIVIVIAGFRMVANGSNPQELGKAKKAIAWAIIGLLVALMSYSIVEIITRIF